MKSVFPMLFLSHMAVASQCDGSSDGVCSQDEATLLQMHGLRKHVQAAKHVAKQRSSSRFIYGDDGVGGNDCPTTDVTEADCLAAVQQLLPDGQAQGRTNLVAGSWGWVPPGCSVQSDFTHGRNGDWAAHYNRNANGQNDGGYTKVCGGAYHYGEHQSNTCPTTPVDEDECLVAVQQVLPPGQAQGRTNLVAGSWGWVPPGCSVQSDFTHGRNGDWAAHYNRNANGQNDGGYTPVCSGSGGPDCRLSAYWEYGNCGCGGNDQNQNWCGGIGDGECPDTVQTGVCSSGTAYLTEWHPKPYNDAGHRGQGTPGHLVRDGCEYIWHAQYGCQEPQFDCRLSAYWEYGSGGCGGNDQNQNWCGGIRAGDCPDTIQTSICPSGTAYLAVWHPKPYDGNSHNGQGTPGHYIRDGVEYIWHAQYACQPEGPVLQNGDFEEGFTPQETGNSHTMSGSGYEYTNIFPGWTAAGGTVMVASGNGPWGGIAASSGNNLLALQGSRAEITQTVFNMRAGRDYTLTVNAAQRTNSPGGTNALLKVSANGEQLLNKHVTATSMEAQVITFTANSEIVQLKIENDVASGDQTVFVDGITLTEA